MGSAQAFPVAAALRLKLLDLLQIFLLNSPVYAAVWHGDRRVLASRSDQDVAPYRHLTTKDGKRFAPYGTDDFAITLTRLLDGQPLHGALADLWQELGEADEEGQRLVRELLTASPNELSTEDAASIEGLGLDAIGAEGETVAEFIQPFRTRYEQILTDSLLDSGPIGRQKLSDGANAANLFTVLRYVPTPAFDRSARDRLGNTYHYAYTARILWRQDTHLHDLCAGHEQWGSLTEDELRAIVQRPLGIGERFIADTCFESGCVVTADLSERHGISPSPHRDFSDGDAEPRHALETFVYSQFRAQQPAAVFIPLHVGGVPWLSLYTLYDARVPSEWWRIYRFYREVVPRLADRVRTAAREAYLECLSTALKDELRLGFSQPAVDRVNLTWKRVSTIYPYPTVQVVSQEATSATAARLQVGSHWLSLRFCGHHRGLEPQLQYEPLSLELVRETLQHHSYAMTAAYEETRRGVSAEVLHGTGTAVSAIGIRELVASISRFRRAPLNSSEDLKFRLVPLRSDAADPAPDFVRRLNAATAAFDSGLALLRFGEMCVEGGTVLREKCQDLFDPPAIVSEIVREASVLATSAFGTGTALNIGDILESGHTATGHWRLPRHYIDRNILRGLFVEILNNALRYGTKVQTPSGVFVNMSVTVAGHGNGIKCTWKNAALPRQESGRTGFLGRLEQAIKTLGYMDFRSRHVGESFVVELDLFSLDAQIETDLLRLTPEWVPDP